MHAAGDLSATKMRIIRVEAPQRMQDKVTALIRPLMTEGASLDRVADGRVVEDR